VRTVTPRSRAKKEGNQRKNKKKTTEVFPTAMGFEPTRPKGINLAG
jgi:hypothetical protein